MTSEHEGGSIPLTAIHIDLRERSISFEADNRTLARLRFTGESVLFEGPSRPPLESMAPATVPSPEPAPTARSEASAEQDGLVTLVGKLLARPMMRRVDRDGLPTASATLAVQEDGLPDPHLYLATFTQHTARLARRLRPESPLIVEGYPSASTDPRQPLDGFTVTSIVAYPGKPIRPEQR
jgi:hypothetical protein